MIIIRFPDVDAEKRALGFLAGRFSFKSWSNGDFMVPEQALASLAVEGLSFFVQGPPSYEQLSTTVRNPSAQAVQ